MTMDCAMVMQADAICVKKSHPWAYEKFKERERKRAKI